ncbi:MAG: hypothetical protein WA477_21450 [Candidatus Sulfotelmatobacter sp.]
MRRTVAINSLLFSFVFLIFSHAAVAQVGVGISVNFGPPPLPVYEQPLCPAEGYIWTPGYWAYDDEDGYYWVPGTWVEAPQVGFLWTPAWWGWGGNAFIFHEGYWGPRVGFYGGINYGFGYGGEGYEGGRWEGNHFTYNTYVTHVNTTIIHNTYNTRVTNVSESHVSYNGGNGGIEARPTREQQSYENEHHVGPVAAQTRHVQAARSNPQLRATVNHGKPPVAATARPADFKTGAVPARQAGGEYKAPPPNAAHGNHARPANAGKPNAEGHPAGSRATPTHASEVQPHKFTPPNTGNEATDKKYQQQQQKLAAKQAQDHQKLQQQQEKEHQQAAKKNYNDAQKQQMEQRHAQQTQQMEQKHATQQHQMEQRQAPRQAAPKRAEKPR